MKNLDKFGYVFLSRSFGNMKKDEVVERFFKNKLEREGAKLFVARCVHGNVVGEIKPETFSDNLVFISDKDGLVAKIPAERKPGRIVLATTFADCFPVVFYWGNGEDRIIGIAHGGYRSVADGILGNMIGKFQAFGLSKNEIRRIRAVIGPGICQTCYEIDTSRFREFFIDFSTDFIKLSADKGKLDLGEVINKKLMMGGLLWNNIERIPECTSCLPEKYFSARRDKKCKPEEVEAGLAMVWAD